MKLKTKLSLGLAFLFVVILTFGTLSIFYINRLSNDSKLVLKNNHESLVYGNNMMKILEDIPAKRNRIADFEIYLKKQEANITEPGEKEATAELRKNFDELVTDPSDSSNYPQIRQSIQLINDLNQDAILRKNEVVKRTAEDATLWLTIIFAVLGIIAFTLVINFPSILSNPIKILNDGIREVANKNYSKRIHLEKDDEFGDLAHAFNSMAEKLNEYENSNLAKLQFEKKRIETIINQMKDGIIGLDKKKNILFLNEVAEGLLGIKEAEIIGQYASDVAIKNDLMRRLLQDKTNTELKIYADNKESYFNKDFLDVVNNGEVEGQVIVLRNVTPFHELNEAKTNFIATVSHELKTPISSIKMSVQLLNDERVGNLNEEQSELVKSITDDSERLLKITSELLNMSQVETGNIQLRMQATRPEVIVQQAVDAVQFKANQKQISFKIGHDTKLPAVYADVEKTAWVLINFLTNAIQYSNENSVIEINTQLQQGSVLFSIKDYGKGIEEKYLPKIFERYFQVPGSSKNGTGLGLAISKEFIEAQGGKIMVESEVSSGSKFSFQLSII